MPRARFQVILFALCLAIPTAFRVWFVAGRSEDLADLGATGLAMLFWTGVRLDAVMASILTAIPCLLLLAAPARALRGTLRVASLWAAAVFLVIAFGEVAGVQFFSFYDFRPNYLVLEHGTDPEVVRTVVAAYPVGWVALGSVGLAAAAWLMLRWLAPLPAPGATDRTARDRLAMFGCVLATALAGRGTLDHRPLNPSAAAFSANRLANELAGNGTYNVVYEALQRRKERYGSVAEYVQPMSAEAAATAAREHLADTGTFVADRANPIVRTVADQTAEGPRNVILVVLESFTGRLIGHLGGELPLSPQLDRLAADGVAFTRCYATGERTIQGLEATLCSFPPLPGVGVIRRPEALLGFDSLGSVLLRAGYDTAFVYGGQGLFDHMRGFFLNNGFARFIEEHDFHDPIFTGDWGVCDEDLYTEVIAQASASHQRQARFLIAALTVSLHSPWEYPDGRIEELPADTDVPAGFELEELNTFLYADHAIGRLIEQARSTAWFDETLFVFVGDHGVHLRGQLGVPVEEYRVPAVFYCPKYLPPQRVGRVTSQLDIAPTIQGLIGDEWTTTFFGEDVLAHPNDAGFALMIYRKQRYAAISGDDLCLLDVDGFTARTRDDTGEYRRRDPTPNHERVARSARGLMLLAEDLLERGTYRTE